MLKKTGWGQIGHFMGSNYSFLKKMLNIVLICISMQIGINIPQRVPVKRPRSKMVF